jgi:hypothetical protein
MKTGVESIPLLVGKILIDETHDAVSVDSKADQSVWVGGGGELYVLRSEELKLIHSLHGADSF